MLKIFKTLSAMHIALFMLVAVMNEANAASVFVKSYRWEMKTVKGVNQAYSLDGSFGAHENGLIIEKTSAENGLCTGKSCRFIIKAGGKTPQSGMAVAFTFSDGATQELTADNIQGASFGDYDATGASYMQWILNHIATSKWVEIKFDGIDTHKFPLNGSGSALNSLEAQ